MVLLLQLILQENIVKVVSRNTVVSVTVHNLAPFRFSLYMLIPVSCSLCYVLGRLQKEVKTKTR